MAESGITNGLETISVRMEPLWAVSFWTPEDDAERILAEITAIDPLPVGERYDRNSFQSAAGIERYRPLQGAAAGTEPETRARPGVVEVSFHIRREQPLPARIVERIFAVHSYQEPIIEVREVLVSRSKGLDDSRNPYRWWNRGGDWKKHSAAEEEACKTER